MILALFAGLVQSMGRFYWEMQVIWSLTYKQQ